MWYLSLVIMCCLLIIASIKVISFYCKKQTAIGQSVSGKKRRLIPISVNFHFTRKCNYECGFCFHTAKSSHITALEEAKRGLSLLRAAGMKKINFSGGEPFLYAKYLGELVKFCKEHLKLESVSIVSNGSKIKESWFESYAGYLDILAISADSFNEETNVMIRRGKGKHLQQSMTVRDLCEKYCIKFKLNTVVCTYNWQEDMVEEILKLRPFRWKVFQCLLVDSENAGENAIRRARDFIITDEQYEEFCAKHRHMDCFVPESNALMKQSYIILDEFMSFLNKGDVYGESKSILEVGVENAIQQIDFDADAFNTRGGVYDWTKTEHLISKENQNYCNIAMDW